MESTKASFDLSSKILFPIGSRTQLVEEEAPVTIHPSLEKDEADERIMGAVLRMT